MRRCFSTFFGGNRAASSRCGGAKTRRATPLPRGGEALSPWLCVRGRHRMGEDSGALSRGFGSAASSTRSRRDTPCFNRAPGFNLSDLTGFSAVMVWSPRQRRTRRWREGLKHGLRPTYLWQPAPTYRLGRHRRHWNFGGGNPAMAAESPEAARLGSDHVRTLLSPGRQAAHG